MPIVSALMGLFLLSGAGIAALPAFAQAPSAPALPAYAVTLTAYNAVPSQTDGTPTETASGMFADPDVVAARSQDLAKELPFGTIIEISGPANEDNDCGYHVVEPIVGYRVIADTMNVRYTKYIDVLFSTKANYGTPDGGMRNASGILGVCRGTTIRVVGHVDLVYAHDLPKTQAELVAIVHATHKDFARK